MTKWRCKIEIKHELAFLSHLEILSAVERSIRRSGLPIAYSEGFNPHMQIGWGPAHAVGVAALGDYCDLSFNDDLAADWLPQLNKALPVGLQILTARELDGPHKSLMAILNDACYEVYFSNVAADVVADGIEQLLSQESKVIERVSPKGKKTFDIRPGICQLTVKEAVLSMEVVIGNAGNVRPEEVAVAVGGSDLKINEIIRTGLYIRDNEGNRMMP